MEAFEEYIDLCCEQAKDKSITSDEQLFFNIYENMLNGLDVAVDAKVFLKEYLTNRYGVQIQQLIEVEPNSIMNRLEETQIA